MSVNLYDNVTFTVEIGFATSSGNNKVPLGGLLTDIVWTDVTNYVREVSTQRGRNSELDEFSTGTSQITLSNRDRRFDPEYSAGPYFGELTPGRPVRVRGKYSTGSTFDLFFGFIDDWQQNYFIPNDSTVTISASDAFKILNSLQLDSYWNYQITQDNPSTWLKLSEATGSLVALDATQLTTGMNWVTTAGAISSAQSVQGIIFDSVDGAASFDGTRGLIIRPGLPNPIPFFPANTERTLEFCFTTTTTADGNYGMAKVDSLETVMGVGMVVSGGVGTLKIWRGSISGINQVNIYTSSVVVNNGELHHVVVPLSGDFVSPVVLPKVDNVNTSLTTTRTWTEDFDNPVNFFDSFGLPMTQLSGDNFSLPFTGVLDEIVVHRKNLTNTEIANHYQIVTGTYLAGQTTSQRIASLLDMGSWMSDGRELGVGNSTVQAIKTSNKTLLSAMKECEEAEQGRLFIGPNGKVKFIGRQEINTTTIYNTSQRTYGDSGSELPYTDIQFAYNDRLISNRVTVSKENGGSFIANDTASQSEYFIRAKNLSDLIVESERFLSDLAIAQVATYKQPELRVQSLEVNPRPKPASLYPAVLSDDVGLRVTVVRRPQSVGSAISKSLILEGVGHSITTDNWVTQYSFSPVPPDYFVLDSETFGVLDQNLLGY
jgi:hypothetical protein